MFRKGLAVAVILLFIGVAFAPSINSSVVKDDFVEFDVEFCGLGKKQTIQLTQNEADEVELLFDDIEQRLSEVETREEAEIIFKDAVVELDKYGLLGGVSVRQAQRLVTRNYNPLGRFKNIKADNNSNYLCLIAGLTYGANFITPILQLLGFIYEIIGPPGPPPLFYILFTVLFPINLLNYITYSDDANGWLCSIGLNGLQFSNGNISNKLSYWFLPEPEMAGVVGFTGIKWCFPAHLTSFTSFYFGAALRVDVDVN